MNEPPIHKCLNCDSEFNFEFTYCASCGQKNTDGKITFSELWVEFQDAIFNIESRTWRTLVAIFIPGKLTLEYFAGKHRRYIHPLRLLIVTSLLTIIAMSLQDFQSATNHPFVIKDRILENYERQRTQRILENIMDSTNKAFPEPSTKIITDSIVNVYEDSLYALLRKRGDRYGDYIDLNDYLDFGSEKTEFISKHDFLTKSEDELVELYKKNAGPIDRLIFRQKTKYIKDESQLSSAILGRFTLAILLMMPFVALILTLLYLRRRYYFIENLIFTFHIHAFSFIIITLMILGLNIWPGWFSILLLFIIEIYLFIALLKVYDQSIFKTLLKFVLLNISYFFLLLVFTFATFFISFLLI